jgi:hypothetical protein
MEIYLIMWIDDVTRFVPGWPSARSCNVLAILLVRRALTIRCHRKYK